MTLLKACFTQSNINTDPSQSELYATGYKKIAEVKIHSCVSHSKAFPLIVDGAQEFWAWFLKFLLAVQELRPAQQESHTTWCDLRLARGC